MLRLLPVMKRALATIMLPLLVAASLHAQEDAGITLRADTRVVQVDVTVRDSSGKPIEDLKQSDFKILDNGKLRPFTIFSVNHAGLDSVQPLPEPLPERPALSPNTFTNIGTPPPPQGGHSTIILLDGANGWFDSFVWGGKGIQGLMGKLPADERIALYVITKFQALLQVVDFTADRERLRRAMATFIPRAMEPAPPGMDPTGDGHGMIEALVPHGTPPDNKFTPQMSPREREYFMRRGSEAVRLSFSALAERLSSLPGRKSVFWVTEGFPPRMVRDDPAWDKTFTNLNDANIAVNTVDTDGLGGPGRFWGPGGIISMQMVAERTGGEAFYHRNDLDSAMAEGITDSRSSYTLGFYLSELDGKYHELKVVVNRPGLDLNYRRGYFARTDAMRDLAARNTELESVLVNPLDLTGIGIVATVETKAENLTVRLRLDPKSLALTERDGVWNGKVEELFIERNDAGGQVARVSQTSRIQISHAAKANYQRSGLALTQTLKLAPNATKLVIAVRDSASGRTGSLTIPLRSGIAQ